MVLALAACALPLKALWVEAWLTACGRLLAFGVSALLAAKAC